MKGTRSLKIGGPLRLLAWPAFKARGNPYNQLLYGHIRKRGAVVEEFSFRKLLAESYDVLHLHWPEWQVSHSGFLVSFFRFLRFLAVMVVARGRGIRVVWTVHNLRPHEPYHPRLVERFYRMFLPRVDGFISLSHANVKSIMESHPRLRGRPHLVTPHGDYRAVYPNSVEKEAARYQLGISNDSVVALYFGTIRTYKNVPALIRQFRNVDDPDFLLLVVGAPSTKRLEDEVVTASGSDRRIRMSLKFVSVEDVQLFFNAADFVVLPFLDSWNSGSAILALSFNRPVLVPETGSVLELQESVGPEWVKTYRGEISPEILQQGFRWKVGMANNPEAPLEGLNWERIAEKTITFFESIGGC